MKHSIGYIRSPSMVHVCLLPILVGIYLVTPHYLASHPQWKSLESRDRQEIDGRGLQTPTMRGCV